MLFTKYKPSKSVVFIVDTLAQHGAERYLLEIVKVLVDNGHSLAVCSIVKIEGNSAYYVNDLEKLGVKVFINPELPFPYIKSKIIKRASNTFAYRVLDKVVDNYIVDKQSDNLMELIKSYDEVSIIKWEVYARRPSLFDRLAHKKIHILSTLSQYGDYPYKELPKGNTEFVLMYREQTSELLSGRKNSGQYNFSTIPLLVDNDKWNNFYSPKNDGIFRIGIFSRIHKDQPTLFALFVIHELKSRGVPVKLYFFGRYYDESFYKQYLKTAETLRILEQVEFMGHTVDLPSAIKDNGLDIGLMNCMNGIIGYSSIEIQSYGLPTVFFNISNSSYLSKEFPVITNNLREVVELMEHYCAAPSELKDFSDITFVKAKENYGVNNNRDEIIKIYS